MGSIIKWFKGAPDGYVETSETNPFPVEVNSSLIHAGSLNGRVSLSTTPAILKVGASSLAERHTLMVYNDASAVVYVGFNSDVTSADGFQLSGGKGITFRFDPDDMVEVYGVLDEGTTDIVLFEIK